MWSADGPCAKTKTMPEKIHQAPSSMTLWVLIPWFWSSFSCQNLLLLYHYHIIVYIPSWSSFWGKKKAPFLDKAAMPLSATSSIGEKSPVSMVKSKKKTAGGHWHIHQLSPVAHGQQNDPHREEPQTVKGCAEHPASVFMPPTLTWLALLMVW